MKKILLICTLLLLHTANVWATPMVGDEVKMTTDPGEYYGMQVTGGDFYNTFCVEKNEYFSNDGMYVVDSVGTIATGGGQSSSWETEPTTGKKGDPLSDETSWLYASFFSGVLDSKLGSKVDAYQVQQAIWYSEEEVSDDTAKNYFKTFTAFANNDFAVLGWDIKVVNLISEKNGSIIDRQSQLVGAPAHAPEPQTMFLMGLGLIGLAGIGRKKSK